MGESDSKYSEMEYIQLEKYDCVTPLEYVLKRKTQSILSSILKTSGASKAIDVGCGGGELLLSRSWIGVDLDKKCLVNIENPTIVGSADLLPVKSNAFDFVISSYCLEHVVNDKDALRELHRILEDEGCLFLEVLYNPKVFSKKDKIVGHFRRYDDALIDVLRENFRVVSIEKHGRGLVYLYCRIRDYLSSDDKLYVPSNKKMGLLRLFLPFINRLMYYGSYLPFGENLWLSLVLVKKGK